jgi:hypothetical protein
MAVMNGLLLATGGTQSLFIHLQHTTESKTGKSEFLHRLTHRAVERLSGKEHIWCAQHHC